MASKKGKIKVISISSSEIPEFVRKACVGLTLSYFQHEDHGIFLEKKIGSKRSETARNGIYCVDRSELLEKLNIVDQEASKWLKNACPEGDFSFDSKEVEILQQTN